MYIKSYVNRGAGCLEALYIQEKLNLTHFERKIVNNPTNNKQTIFYILNKQIKTNNNKFITIQIFNLFM
jgi:hypothetical protein